MLITFHVCILCLFVCFFFFFFAFCLSNKCCLKIQRDRKKNAKYCKNETMPRVRDDTEKPTSLKGLVLKQNKSRHQFFFTLLKCLDAIRVKFDPYAVHNATAKIGREKSLKYEENNKTNPKKASHSKLSPDPTQLPVHDLVSILGSLLPCAPPGPSLSLSPFHSVQPTDDHIPARLSPIHTFSSNGSKAILY
uniref:Uncharacterized protein n=1 Tax=Cucumis melo TaxID=3656 RepID=A0A9I9EJ59_CUCME